jgi:hypothetical protein
VVDAAILEANRALTQQLEALAGRLSDADLGRDLGGGRTVSVALAHLAFWDRRVAYVLTRWMHKEVPHQELDDDVVNNALEELHKAIEPRAAARLAIDSAKSADAAIADVSDAIAGQLIADGHQYLLNRTNHRREHIEQIEAVL